MDQTFRLKTDHFQFLIGDRAIGYKADTSQLWDNLSGDHRVAEMPGLLGVTTARFGGTTHIRVSIGAVCPPLMSANWDSLVESSLEVPSGEVVLWSPELEESNCESLKITPGKYNAVLAFKGTANVKDELATEGTDEYHIMLWGPV